MQHITIGVLHRKCFFDCSFPNKERLEILTQKEVDFLSVFIYSKRGRTITQMTFILKNIKSFDWDTGKEAL